MGAFQRAFGFLIAVAALRAAEANPGIYLGTDLGYTLKSGVTAPEVSNGGLSFAGKLGLTHSWTSVTGDVGLGYVLDRLSKNSISIQSRAFYSELSFRYRLTESWSVGPAVNLLFGQDVSFSESTDTPKSLAILAGARVTYDLPSTSGRSSWRFGFQILTDLDIPARQIVRAQGLVEWVYRFGAGAPAAGTRVARRARRSEFEPAPPPADPTVIEEVSPQPPEAEPVPEPVPPPAPVPQKARPRVKPVPPPPPPAAPKPKVKPPAPAPAPIKLPPKSPPRGAGSGESFNLTQYGVKFEGTTANLDLNSRALLNRIAIVLAENNAQWSRISIEADNPARAQAVVTDLLVSGVDESKMRVTSTTNRRVEIKFPGQKLKGEFSQAFRKALSASP